MFPFIPTFHLVGKQASLPYYFLMSLRPIHNGNDEVNTQKVDGVTANFPKMNEILICQAVIRTNF